ncbi:MAG: branched-chain amino acid ABC transporter substrate-binding protein [Chloroflexi bacterium]|nr:branched-chain amino acid ABC transporter substrate-binding protein [Chloroflexota bacterium]
MKVFNKKGLSALAAVAILAAACGGSTASTAGKTLTIGISFPLNGSALASAGPARDGALLAIKEASIEGYTLKAKVLDHAKEGAHNPDQAAADMLTFVGQEDVVAVVGPFNSASARAQIPVSSEAGLLQCSPSNTNPTLTKGADGEALRGGRNYVRVATTDDLQGPAVAVYAKKNGAAKIYILDSTDAYGKGVADAFEAKFIADGGTVVGRQGLPTGTTDFSAAATAAKAAGADSIFYGGVTSDGAPLFRNALAQAGLGALPFYGADGIYDGTSEGSYIAIAGANAENSYASQAAIENIPGKADFNVKFKAEFGKDAEGYAYAGYACAQIIIEGIAAAVAGGDVTRETVRAAVVDKGAAFETVLGSVSFDAVGDTTQRIISLYKVDGGAWKFVEEINYGN